MTKNKSVNIGQKKKLKKDQIFFSKYSRLMVIFCECNYDISYYYWYNS